MSPRRGPSSYPKALGEFVRLGWTMRGGCSCSAGLGAAALDMEAAVRTFGADYPTRQWMIDEKCPKCGTKLGLLDMSPEEVQAGIEAMRAVMAAR
jgi:hypothetical protein